MKQFEIVTQPIETEQYRDFTINERQGAVVVFTGHVRAVSYTHLKLPTKRIV